MATSTESSTKENLFPLLGADDADHLPTEMESFCINCEKNGITRLLLTRIPFYKEVILMSFQCDHCGYRNNEIQSGGKVQEQGIRYIVKICDKQDLNRQVVKSEYAGVSIPEVDFEIPQKSQAGEVTNVEGIISRTIECLKHGQEQRRLQSPVKANQIDEFIVKLEGLLRLENPFTLVIKIKLLLLFKFYFFCFPMFSIVDDPSGNSFVENPLLYQVDKNTTVIHYHRTLQQDKMLALVADDVEEEMNDEEAPPVWESREAVRNEVLKFHVNCPNCQAPADTNMKFVNIPYFKEVVIMATNCSECGHRTAEVKSGGGFADKGSKLTLHVLNPVDLSRDILKSETCSVSVPELQLEAGMGILGGRFTTVEGLLLALKHEIGEQSEFALGDSADMPKKEKMEAFLQRLSDAIELKSPVHLILDDPAGNSYIQSLTAPEPDNQLNIEYYDRSYEQNESLGLNDMNTENYSCDADS